MIKTRKGFVNIRVKAWLGENSRENGRNRADDSVARAAIRLGLPVAIPVCAYSLVLCPVESVPIWMINYRITLHVNSFC